MVTAICNILIDSDAKFELFKEAFSRVYGISDNWLIHIRGRHSRDVVEYIQKSFPDYPQNYQFFSNLYDRNWAKSTRKMLAASRYEYIYVFLEDHLLLKPLTYFKDVIRNMVESKIEYFGYSFFNVGLSMSSAEGLYPDYLKHFFAFQFNQKNIWYLKKYNRHFYPYSLASVSTKKYFQKLLAIESAFLIKVPFLLQAFMENCFFIYPRNRTFWFAINKLTLKVGVRFVIYPPATPFNLEKSLFDCNAFLLPLTIGGLREELFANWDDDHIVSGSSLVKRGLYPPVLKSNAVDTDNGSVLGKEYTIAKGVVVAKQFYPEIRRISFIPLKKMLIKSGSVKIYSDQNSYVLKQGEEICLHANIPHKIEALEDVVYSETIYLKP